MIIFGYKGIDTKGLEDGLKISTRIDDFKSNRTLFKPWNSLRDPNNGNSKWNPFIKLNMFFLQGQEGILVIKFILATYNIIYNET